MPLFSVIIPVWNRGDLIVRTLESALAQTCRDFEILVVDDGSTDHTPQVLQRYGTRIRILRQDNAGPAAARNTGIRQARGEYIAFLDSDDLWFPWTLATYQQVIAENGRPSLVYGQPLNFRQEEEVAGYQPGPLAVRTYADFLSSFAEFLTGTTEQFAMGTPSTVVRADVLPPGGGFPPMAFNAEDIDFVLSLGTARGFVVVDSPLTVAHRRHAASLMANVDSNYEGMRYLAEREKLGAYAGGVARQPERRMFLARELRNWSLKLLTYRMYAKAFELYRIGLGWQLRQGRFRYLLAFPALALWGVVTPWAPTRPSPAPETGRPKSVTPQLRDD